MRLPMIVLVLLVLAGCGTSQHDSTYTAPWLVGQAGPPFPYNSPWCP